MFACLPLSGGAPLPLAVHLHCVPGFPQELFLVGRATLICSARVASGALILSPEITLLLSAVCVTGGSSSTTDATSNSDPDPRPHPDPKFSTQNSTTAATQHQQSCSGSPSPAPSGPRSWGSLHWPAAGGMHAPLCAVLVQPPVMLLQPLRAAEPRRRKSLAGDVTRWAL